MNVPVFIDISLEEQVVKAAKICQKAFVLNACFLFQAVELRSYFKSLGAEITLERSEKGIEDDLVSL